MMRRLFSCLIATAVLAAGACSRNDTPEPPPATTEAPNPATPTERVVGPLSEEDARALATMNDRLREYVDLHRKVEGDLPDLPTDATPEQIDQKQRELQKKMAEARASAKPGDLFTPEAQPVIKRLLAQVFEGPQGRQLKASIMDENPTDLATYKLSVNARYPDTVPVTTVPVDVLQTLPKLSEDLEYRFVGDALILLDTHAHTIADYIENALPQ
ncbi:MAG TPA: hypothetical protein VFZ36_12465 [Vicinamibacterales bacterium]